MEVGPKELTIEDLKLIWRIAIAGMFMRKAMNEKQLEILRSNLKHATKAIRPDLVVDVLDAWSEKE